MERLRKIIENEFEESRKWLFVNMENFMKFTDQEKEQEIYRQNYVMEYMHGLTFCLQQIKNLQGDTEQDEVES